MPEAEHIPVLVDEVLEALSPRAGEVYADATAGLGGHAVSVGRLLGPSGLVVLNDVDPSNLARARGRLADELGGDCPRLVTIPGNFADLPRRLIELGVAADLFVADLGFSSNQMADPSRGLSFGSDGPLDMRLDPTLPTSAADLVADLPVPELERIIREYGQERQAGRIARKLAESRAREPITSTGQLAQIVRSVLARHGSVHDGIDPATRTFQALRIAVNDELGVLESLLSSIRRAAETVGGIGRPAGDRPTWLKPGARVAFIAFHSLEDRPVKHAMAELVRDGVARLTGPRLQRASDEELETNRRSRSARLRAICLNTPQSTSAPAPGTPATRDNRPSV